MNEKNHALVFGASGIQGCAVTNQLLSGYPSPVHFDRTTALTNRPIVAETLWPESSKLHVVSGIDLLDSSPTLAARVPSINTVTHVFFVAYMSHDDPQKEVDINLDDEDDEDEDDESHHEIDEEFDSSLSACIPFSILKAKS